MTVKIEMLRCFVAVAHSGNLADAADKLCRTPSAVSMMLKQFEAHLGAPLFESERKSKLTALGTFALAQAVAGIEHFERSVSAMESFARCESGLVRIAAVPSFAESILPQAVLDFVRDYPGVWIDIRDMDSAAVLHELERERVDLGIASGGGRRADIRRETLFSDALGVVCRADHPLAAADRPLRWDELARWPFIANGLCSRIADRTFQRLFARSQMMVRNTSSLLALVRADVGVTVLPRLAVDGARGDIVFAAVADPQARRRIDLLYRGSASPPPAARRFADCLHRVCRETLSGRR